MKPLLKCLNFSRTYVDFFPGPVGICSTFLLRLVNCVHVCVIRGQLDMQLIPRKLHRCRPVRDSGHVAAAWVCLCLYVGMSFLTILYIHGMCVCVHMSKCVLRQLPVYGVLWRQGAERRVSCDLDDR